MSRLEEGQRLYREIFARDPLYKVTVFDGMKETLKELKRRGVKLAVLSNKPHLRTLDVIHDIFGDGTFDVVRGQQDGVPRKPSPVGVQLILEELGLTPEDLLYIGDTGTDMQTGKAAGAFTVGALWGFRTKEELLANHADAVIENPLRLLDYLA